MISYNTNLLYTLLFISYFFINNHDTYDNRIKYISSMDGLIAFWDFNRVSKTGRWESYYDSNIVNKSFEINLKKIGDENKYNVFEWPYHDDESKLLYDKSGPFGKAIRFNQGHIFGEIDRVDFDNTPLNVYGEKSFTLIAWCKFIGYRHMVAGIWDEGGWDKYKGRRQYALFGGLFNSTGVIGHISTTGASSFPQSTIEGSQYARKSAIDGDSFENHDWVMMAMTFDSKTNLLRVYKDGISTISFRTDPVEMDVYNYKKDRSTNPYYFHWPIYSPDAITIKYNGYSFIDSGYYEHWIHFDFDNMLADYGNISGSIESKDYFKSEFIIYRDGEQLYKNFNLNSSSNTSTDIEIKSINDGDIIETTLYRCSQINDCYKVGSTINYEIQEGAPFTFGRALGLGEEPIDYGSQLFLDGVAVFNRVLSDNELRSLNFN